MLIENKKKTGSSLQSFFLINEKEFGHDPGHNRPVTAAAVVLFV